MRSALLLAVSVTLSALVSGSASAQAVEGVWLLRVDLGTGGGGEATFVLEQDGGVITGTYSGAYGTNLPVSGTARDGRIAFTFRTTQMGEIAYDGQLDADTMRGSVTYGTTARGTFEGRMAETATPLSGTALTSKIDSLVESVLEAGSVAAMSIGVRRGDDVLITKGYGLADIENDVPAGAETVYRIGSITKQFTAAAVMQLVESGAIELDDPMTEYLPDYPMQGHVVTIRHLLGHTSGIKSYTGLAEWQPTMRMDLTDDELVALFSDEPFDFAPGERYLYNNSGFYLLGMIVAAASGESYRDYLRAHIFEPLGLGGSSYCDEQPIIANRAEGYELVRGELLNDQPLSMNHPGAAGALCSTVEDLLVWTSALREGRVVSAASYDLMTTPGTLNSGAATSYGFGLGLGQLVGHASVSHGGGINGFNTMLAHYPASDLDVVVLTNTAGPFADRTAETIAKWALGIAVATVADEPVTPREIAAYVGVYQLAPGFELTVFEQNGQLWTQATGQGAARLRSQGDGRFVPTFDDDVRVEFVMEGGRATTLVLFQGARREAPRVR
jgi:CubicO group peptidase (beta-lactamase class C family)